MKTLYILLIAIALIGCSTTQNTFKSYRNHFYYINHYGTMLKHHEITYKQYSNLVKLELELMKTDSLILKKQP